MTAAADLVTREELAELYGIHPLTVDAWQRRGMPSAGEAPAGRGADRRRGRRWHVTRRQLAKRWALHPDSVTKLLPEGLGAAVVGRIARGELVFDYRIALRWQLARDGQLNNIVLEDLKACAAANMPALHVLSIASVLEDGGTGA